MSNYFRFFISLCFILVTAVAGEFFHASDTAAVHFGFVAQKATPYNNNEAEVNDADPNPDTALAHLQEQGQADLPQPAIINHSPNQYDSKSALRAPVTGYNHHSYTPADIDYRSKILVHPPITATIDYYIYALRQILI